MNRQGQTNELKTVGGSEALRESQWRYRTLFDLAPIAVYSCDASGVVRDGSLYIQISDQGVGFDPRVSATKGDHSPAAGFGLLSIRERMLSLGGRFELESSPGNGTTATLVLPLGECAVESAFIASHGSIREKAKGRAHNREQAPAMTTGQSRNTVEHFTSAYSCPIRVLVADDHAWYDKAYAAY